MTVYYGKHKTVYLIVLMNKPVGVMSRYEPVMNQMEFL
jgi:hypothetical protein